MARQTVLWVGSRDRTDGKTGRESRRAQDGSPRRCDWTRSCTSHAPKLWPHLDGLRLSSLRTLTVTGSTSSGTDLLHSPGLARPTTVDMSLSGSRLSHVVRAARMAAFPQVRCLATPSSSKTSFSRELADGPSLDDFIADRVPERVVLGNANA